MSDMLPILAVETSDELCSTAILLDEKSFYERNIKGKHVHSEKLVPMMESIIEEASIRVEQLGAIAVSEGPGSFTGLRIGMAAAKGLAFGMGIPIIPVPTFDAIAHRTAMFLPDKTIFNIIKKANREEYYFAKYQKTGDVDTLIPLSLLSGKEVEASVNKDELKFESENLKNEINDLTTPRAIDIALWAYKFGKDLLTSDYDLIEPKYLKKFVVKEKK